jgi:signal peptidase I
VDVDLRAPHAPATRATESSPATTPGELLGSTPVEAIEASPEAGFGDPRRARPAQVAGAPGGAAPARARLSGALRLGAVALLAYVALFNFSVVRGSSMAPRIHDGDRILIDHWSYLLGPVARGDIVVLKYPLDPSVDYIKRVIGLPGDRVVLQDGKVYVNGEELAEPYVEDPDALTDMAVRVLPAHYFVLGDNRRRSCDSREFGQVPCDYVRGKVAVRVWPPERVGRIDA